MKSKLTDFNACFDIASEISQNEDKEKLIEVIENWGLVHPSIKPVFISLIEGFGFYPYLNLNSDVKLDIAASMRAEYHKSQYIGQDENIITFHFEQKELEERLSQEKNLLVSAPTSFGKSLLIEEFVARRKFDNILIIQPTLALIDETRRKLQKYDDYYNVVVNTHQKIQSRNIFILTSERVLDIFPRIKGVNLLVVDEFYKISNTKKDERVSHLNIAFYKIMKFNPQLLLLTPSIDDVSKDFIQRYDLEFFKTDYSLVNQKLNEISYNDKEDKDGKLIELLGQLNDPTIVYVKSPTESERLANLVMDRMKLSTKKYFPIFEWIDENISPLWKLKDYLKNGIGLHNGQYPRHIVNSQLEYFNKGDLKVIFATTSLIEGVNSVAKNVVIYDMYKGTRKLTYFDFNNIKGRAGRMMKYYTGNIYYFDTPPQHITENLDIPIVDQEKEIQTEILINLDEQDIKKERKDDYERIIQQLPNKLLKIFKENYYDVDSQMRLYNYLLDNKDSLQELIWQVSHPKYKQLSYTLKVVINQLLGKGGDTNKYWATKCLQIANNNLKQAIDNEIRYLSSQKSNKNDLEISNEVITSKAITSIFEFIKKQAKYEIPKLLSILQNILNYIIEEDGTNEMADYSFFIARLEHEGIDEHLSILLDFGVPSSALRKLNIPQDVDTIAYIKKNFRTVSEKLSKYETDILRQI